MILSKNQLIIPSLLFVLFPFFYITGIAVVEFFFIFLLIFFIFKNDQKKLFIDKKFIFLLIFSAYISFNHVIQFEKYFEYSFIFHFRYPILSIMTLFFFKNLENYKIKNYFFFLGILFFSIIFFDSFIQFLLGKNLLGYEIINNRISSFFGEELVLGSFLIKILPFVIWYIYFFKINLKNNYFLISFFFSLYYITIFLSGGRTAFFLLLLFLLLLFIFLKSLRKIILVSSSILIVLLSLIFLSNLGRSTVFHRMLVKPFHQMTNEIYTQTKIDYEKKEDRVLKNNFMFFSKNHQGHYELALDLFFKKPIFGNGPKGFRYYCRSVNYSSEIGICTTHPHNTLIQILAELGLIGFLFYAYGIFFVIQNLFRCMIIKTVNNHKDLLVIASITILVNFFPFVPSGNFFNNWTSITSFYYIGIFLYSYKRIFS